MFDINCKAGLPVKILSKSTGQNIRDLNGIRKGIIDRVKYNKEIVVIVDIRENDEYHYNFLSKDLEPLWEDDK